MLLSDYCRTIKVFGFRHKSRKHIIVITIVGKNWSIHNTFSICHTSFDWHFPWSIAWISILLDLRELLVNVLISPISTTLRQRGFFPTRLSNLFIHQTFFWLSHFTSRKWTIAYSCIILTSFFRLLLLLILFCIFFLCHVKRHLSFWWCGIVLTGWRYLVSVLRWITPNPINLLLF